MLASETSQNYIALLFKIKPHYFFAHFNNLLLSTVKIYFLILLKILYCLFVFVKLLIVIFLYEMRSAKLRMGTFQNVSVSFPCFIMFLVNNRKDVFDETSMLNLTVLPRH